MEFDPVAKRLESGKQMLGYTKNNWLMFRDWDDKLLLYFSTIVSHHAVLREIRYGLDTDVPDRVFPLKKVGPNEPYPSDMDSLPYLSVPKSTRYATVQLTFVDGTKSEIVRHDR